jgi:hypothetical protein
VAGSTLSDSTVLVGSMGSSPGSTLSTVTPCCTASVAMFSVSLITAGLRGW